MCVLKLPLKLIEIFDRARRHCLWRKENDKDAKTHSLAAWNVVCRPKKRGGLGVLNLQIQNKALLLKYIHKFMHKQDTPWVLMVWDAYYDDTPPHAKPSCGSFWWRDVFSLMDIYHGITSCIPATGDTILLWKDVWLEDRPLMDTHEHLFSYTKNEDVSLAQFYNNNTHVENFMLPLSMEARTKLDDLQTMMAGINLEPMGTMSGSYVGETQITDQKSSITSCSEMCWHHNSSPRSGRQNAS